ncbi:hypothetical protein EDD17DRAFT_1506877 [Pisolithus thermaeus]|nr:hypothetical protein EDD17DRAFT_1506877 [Pisolithus thermaeus]
MNHHDSGGGEATRLVLIVGNWPPSTPQLSGLMHPVDDGLLVDLLFTSNGFAFCVSSPTVVAPSLGSIAEERGAFNVSHTRVPTESCPGGMYEDVSAVTKAGQRWKTNPLPSVHFDKVDFDSAFNQSRRTFSFGFPDIPRMFAKGASPDVALAWYYDEEAEDFTKDGYRDPLFPQPNLDPDHTRIPLITWSNGVRGPLPDLTPSLRDVYSERWRLGHLPRLELSRADLALLIARLIGINWPSSSVGMLPDIDPTRANCLALLEGDEALARYSQEVGSASSNAKDRHHQTANRGGKVVRWVFHGTEQSLLASTVRANTEDSYGRLLIRAAPRRPYRNPVPLTCEVFGDSEGATVAGTSDVCLQCGHLRQACKRVDSPQILTMEMIAGSATAVKHVCQATAKGQMKPDCLITFKGIRITEPRKKGD